MINFQRSLSSLRWKLAVFIFRFYPFWAAEGTIRYIPRFKPTWTFWTCLRDSLRIENELSPDDYIIGYYLLAFILSPIWFPYYCIDYFLITTYYSQFPEALI
jgi:hypothetical protein